MLHCTLSCRCLLLPPTHISHIRHFASLIQLYIDRHWLMEGRLDFFHIFWNMSHYLWSPHHTHTILVSFLIVNWRDRLHSIPPQWRSHQGTQCISCWSSQIHPHRHTSPTPESTAIENHTNSHIRPQSTKTQKDTFDTLHQFSLNPQCIGMTHWLVFKIDYISTHIEGLNFFEILHCICIRLVRYQCYFKGKCMIIPAQWIPPCRGIGRIRHQLYSMGTRTTTLAGWNLNCIHRSLSPYPDYLKGIFLCIFLLISWILHCMHTLHSHLCWI